LQAGKEIPVRVIVSHSVRVRRSFHLGFVFSLALSAIALTLSGQSSVLRLDAVTAVQARALQVKNVVLMIPDGMGVAQTTIARWYKYAKTGINRLSFDELACGMVRTYWATGLITDSAPAASAMAAGYKTSAGYIGLRPAKTAMPGLPELSKGDESTPVATILEAARLDGRSTGLVVTCEFPHATPAGFSSHFTQRSAMDLLAEQQVYQNMDVVLGGGRKYLDPAARKDKEDLVKVLRERGYRYITDRQSMLDAPDSRLWGAFAAAGMERDLDRDPSREPSLAEMTLKALRILSKNKRGFFLMVEGSQVDWAGHANDPVGVATEALAFDAAVQNALDFARRDGETAVIIAADHSTGGMSLGTPEAGDVPMAGFSNVLLKAKSTPAKVAQRLTEGVPPLPDTAKDRIAEWLGLSDLHPEEAAVIDAALKARSAKRLELELGRALSRRAGVGWVFTGHGGDDVTLYIHHPRDLRIGGVVQNSDIAFYMARLLGVNLGVATGRLFAPAGRDFAALGASVSVDAADPENPVFQAVKNGRTLRLAANKNTADLNGRPILLDGVVVCTGAAATIRDPAKWFVPRMAVDLLK
jgi:alkaline phosphatase